MLQKVSPRLSLLFALVPVAALGSMTYQTMLVQKNQAWAATQADMARTGVIFATDLAHNVQAEMTRAGLFGSPGDDLIAGQARQMADLFPGKLTIYKLPAGVRPVLSTLDAAALQDLSALAPDAAANHSIFMAHLGGHNYVTLAQPISFSGDAPDYVAFIQQPAAKVFGPYMHLRDMALLHLLAAFAASLVLGSLTGLRLSRRLNKLSIHLEHAERGERPAPESEGGAAELARLARAVNRMVQGPSPRDKVREQANTDALTGLANRRALVAAMDDLLKKGHNEVCLMFLDLDGFKPINDTYGHEVGDDVLIEVAKRLDSCVREQDLICRLGGDEFVIMLRNLTERPAIEERAKKVLTRINEPYWVGDQRVTMGVSVGISIGPQDGADGETLLGAADEAMYAAKRTGKNQYTFYS